MQEFLMEFGSVLGLVLGAVVIGLGATSHLRARGRHFGKDPLSDPIVHAAAAKSRGADSGLSKV